MEPGGGIVAGLSKLPGASDPSAIEVALESDGTGKAAGVRAQTADFKSSAKLGLSVQDGEAKIVAKVEGDLPALLIPASIPAGAYRVSARVLAADGSVLQSSKTVVFIGLPRPAIDSVTSFPPAVEPGAPVLLSLSISRAGEGGEADAPRAAASWDPWIAWSADGRTFAEGPLSAGFDETVWQAPSLAGAYSVAAQVYPAAPPSGGSFSFKSAARKDLRVMAIASPCGSGDDFADPLSFLCLLRLDGDFSDSGTRPRLAPPESFGSPRLDVYPSGFGYRLDAQAGIRVPALMPPAQGGRLQPFSVLVRLDPDQGEGAVARFASDDGTYSLTIGLRDWKPYAEFSFDGRIQRSAAVAAVPHSPLTLEAVFRPEGERLAISWRAEGQRIESPSMPLPPPPPADRAGGARLGGPLSLPGVYDGFGLSAGAPSPAFRLASRRAWKAALILAEGFEDERLPRLSTPEGGAAAAAGVLSLEPGSALRLEPAFDPASGVAVEASVSGDTGSARLYFAFPSGAPAFSVTATGEVLGPDGASLGPDGASLGAAEARSGRLSIVVSSAEGGYLVSSPGGAAPISVPCDPSPLRLSLGREGGSGELAFESVLARRIAATADR